MSPPVSDANNVGICRTDLDESVSPTVSFYQYANGGWMSKNPIPDEHPAWNNFLVMHSTNQERLRALLADLNPAAGGEETLLSCFYPAAMDETAIEQEGCMPLSPVLIAIEAARDPALRAKVIAQLHASYGVSRCFFSLYAGPDKKDSNHSICQVSQAGLGLPDRDYYFDVDKEDKRQAYVKHIATMLGLLHTSFPKLGYGDEVACAAAAQSVFALEVSLAGSHFTKTENRDPEATYNKMSVAELSSKVCEGKFDWSVYFQGIGFTDLSSLGDVNVLQLKAMKHTASAVQTAAPEDILHYLRWHAVHCAAPYLAKAFVLENFAFYETMLAGTKELKPRWKRAMAFTEGALGEAMGKLYCARHFDESKKVNALRIVEEVRKALESRLKEVKWMTANSTREAALEKMKRFRVKIGYPEDDAWTDFSSLSLSPDDSFFTMATKCDAFHFEKQRLEMNQPTNRSKWLMTPQTINAYFHPSLNEIVFPAAILQPPFFDANADDAVNYGAIGAIVGHEMTHGFDDQGRKYNADGNMLSWWTPEDEVEYEKRVAVMVGQASAFEVEGVKVQGKLTCGENIADLGGLRLALRALHALPNFNPDLPLIDGFTPLQRFFLSWGTAWRQNIKSERSKQLGKLGGVSILCVCFFVCLLR